MPNSKKVAIYIYTAVAILLLLMLISYFSSGEELQETVNTDVSLPVVVPEADIQNEAPQEQVAKALKPNSALGYVSKFGSLPDSLSGAELNLHFYITPDGELIMTESIKDIFDYFLSAVGEEPIETIIGRIQEFIHHHLQDPARQRALETLEQYIAMKEALQSLEDDAASMGPDSTNYDIHQMRDQLEARRDVRLSNLDGEIYEAFYEEEDRYDEATLGRFEIMADKNLTEEERQDQLQEYEANLPDEMREMRASARAHITLSDTTQEMIKEGASSDEIYQMRVETVGQEAAERLAVLDEKRALWDSRVSEYKRQRDQILQQEGLTQGDLNTEVMQLRSRLFDEQEQMRIQVLDQRDGIDI